jgi:hypothetical protein
MNTLYAISALEVMAWCFFFKRTALIHAAALLIFVKILFPIIKSVLLHVCWRIPRAFIRHEFVATLGHHSFFSVMFQDPYKKFYRGTNRKLTASPIKEPGKREIATPAPIPPEVVPQNPGYPIRVRTDFLGYPIVEDEDKVISASMRKIDKEIEEFYRENG